MYRRHGLFLILFCLACSGAERYAANTMLADLRLLQEAQAAAAREPGGAFLPPGTATSELPLQGYAPSAGVVVVVHESTPERWSATATHADAPGRTCGIFVGPAAPGGRNPATVSGQPRCN